MKWITRQGVRVDRVACPWLIKNFVDPEAEFLFVPADEVSEVARRQGATPFDVPGAELGHHDGKCSFDAILAKHPIQDAAIDLLARIVRAADIEDQLGSRPEAAGLRAIAEGFRHLGLKDDHEIVAQELIVYDALYAYCRQQVKDNGNPNPADSAQIGNA